MLFCSAVGHYIALVVVMCGCMFASVKNKSDITVFFTIMMMAETYSFFCCYIVLLCFPCFPFIIVFPHENGVYCTCAWGVCVCMCFLCLEYHSTQ